MEKACQECPLYGKKPVLGKGPKDAKLVIIGECPGRTEEKLGAPFVGESGQLLDKLLREAGLDRAECYVTNVVACRPTDTKGGNETPTAAMIKACSSRLEAELAQLSPSIVLLLGNIATKRFLGTSRNLNNSEGIPFRQGRFVFVPTYHPAALLRDSSKIPTVVETLKRVKKWLTSDPFEWTFSNYLLLYKKDEVLYYLDKLLSASEWACDIETSDITLDSVIFTIAFATDDLVFGFPIRNPDFSLYWSTEDLQDIVEKLKIVFESDSKKIFHNAQFDLTFLLKEFGIECKNLWWDTFVFEHLLDETSASYGLKRLVWKYLGKGGYDSEYETIADEGRPFGVATDVVLKYNCADAYATFMIYKKMKSIASPDLVKLHQRLSIPVTRMLIRTRLRGIKIDPEYIVQLKRQFENDLVTIEQKIHEIAGHSFNINSTRALSKVLFEELKLPVIYRTKTGSPSTDTDTLAKIEHYHPIISQLLEYRKKKKLVSTYFDNFLELKDSANRLHTEYLLVGTATGRLASRNPNLQNIPRDKEVKDIFVADDGYFLAEFDFKQIELRMLCHYSQDPQMKAEFESGFDILKYMASKVFNVDILQVTDEQRRLAKFVVYGLMYGRGVKSIAESHNITVEEASRIVDAFFSAYPKAHRWFKEVVIKAKTQGYLQNFFGRIRRFRNINSNDPDVRSKEERQALNFLPQSTASDYTMFKASILFDMLRKFDTYLVLTVHDSIVYEIPEKYATDVLTILFEVLNKPVKGLFVRIPFDCAIGYRLGSLQEISSVEQAQEVLLQLKKEVSKHELSGN